MAGHHEVAGSLDARYLDAGRPFAEAAYDQEFCGLQLASDEAADTQPDDRLYESFPDSDLVPGCDAASIHVCRHCWCR